MLAMMLLSLAGMPLAQDRSAKSTTNAGEVAERFPCENCPCGCSTAEFCWDRCCCHSDEEKLVWAQQNDVRPPEFLVARVKLVQVANLAAIDPPPACPHCAAKKPMTKAPDITPESKVVLLWKAMECRGIESFWTMLSCVVVPSPAVVTTGQPWLIARIVLKDESAGSVDECPEPPVG